MVDDLAAMWVFCSAVQWVVWRAAWMAVVKAVCWVDR